MAYNEKKGHPEGNVAHRTDSESVSDVVTHASGEKPLVATGAREM